PSGAFPTWEGEVCSPPVWGLDSLPAARCFGPLSACAARGSSLPLGGPPVDDPPLGRRPQRGEGPSRRPRARPELPGPLPPPSLGVTRGASSQDAGEDLVCRPPSRCPARRPCDALPVGPSNAHHPRATRAALLCRGRFAMLGSEPAISA